MVSHDHRVLQYADRIVWLEDGHIEEREPESMTAGRRRNWRPDSPANDRHAIAGFPTNFTDCVSARGSPPAPLWS